jgi:hypothetical protein
VGGNSLERIHGVSAGTARAVVVHWGFSSSHCPLSTGRNGRNQGKPAGPVEAASTGSDREK